MPTVPTLPNDPGRELSYEEVMGMAPPTPPTPPAASGAPAARAGEMSYDEVMGLVQQDTSTRVRASARLADGMNPQQVLEAERLGSQYGLPTDVVQRQLPEVRRAAEADRLDRMLYGAPRVAEFVAEAPENLAVARDDVEQLALLERLMAGYNPEDLPEGLQTAGAVVQGGIDLQRAFTGSVVGGFGSAIRGFGELPGMMERQSQRAVSGLIGLASEELAARFDQTVAENRARLPWWLTTDLASAAGQTVGGGIADFGAAIGPPEARQNVATDLAAGGGSLATYLTVGTLTGGTGVVALGAGQGMDLQAERARAAGTYGTAEADTAIALGGTVTAATERMGIGFLLRRLPPSVREGLNRRVADIVMGGLAEGAQEVTEKLAQDTVTRVLVDDSFEVMEGWQQDGAMGFVLGALFRGGVHVVRSQADAALAQSERSQVEGIGRVVDGLQLGQQDPGRLRGLLARLTTAGREDVYVPVSEFQTLFQSEQEIDAALDAAGMDRGDYAQALLSNGRVRIPTEGFFTSFTPEQRGKLYPVARWTPNGMTPAEAESYDPEAALADFMAAVGEQGRPADDPANRVYEDMRQQLEASGATPDVAAAQAEQFAAFIRTQAAREGVSIDTLIGAPGQERVRVTSPVDPRVQAVFDGPQGDPMIDAVIDAARAGRTFTDRQVRGTRLVSMLVGRGGIRADAVGADNLRAMDAQLRPGLLRTNGDGMTLDDALRVAREAGYIDQPIAQETERYDPSGPDIGTILDLIADDLSGVSPVFATGDVNLDREAFNQSVEGLLQELDERGIGREQLDGMTNAQVRELLGLNRTEADARFDQRPAVEYVAEVAGETWRLTDSPAPPGTDYSEFGEIRVVRAYDGERLVGKLIYGNDGTPPTVEVAGLMRRRNIGTSMMALAEKQGGILGDPETGIRGKGAEYRTSDGQAFRRGADTSKVKLTLVGPVRMNQSAPSDADGAAGGAAEAFRGVTREQFLGSPKILSSSSASDLAPKALTTVAEAAPEPFLGDYEARYSEDGVAVYDGDKVIASYNFGDTLVVDKKYRRQGIAEEMVYQWRTRNPSAKPATSRTKASQALQVKVWDRIQRELSAADRSTILDQRNGDTARGSIEIRPAGYPGGVRQFVINLGETRDFSTFLHESGHFYLEVMRESNARLSAADPAKLTPSQRQLLEDHAALLRELGVRSFDEVQTIHHERFAETYEAYLREGRAPSTRLQRAFQKFGAWLKMIYRSLRQLPNARLNDQARSIMDRMLATDDEIEAARQAQGLQALFETPEAAGMDEAEFGRYQEAVRASRQAAIDAEAAEQYRYERAEAKRWRTAVMAELTVKATRAMNDVPVYRALSNMRRGKMPDGSDLPAGERQIKLSSELVNDLMGPGWAGRNLAGAVAADGKSPDLVAAVFGFPSGRDLITALANAPKMKDAIRAEADRLWRETYPDPMLDGELSDRVQGRVHNDAQAQVMAREIAALERKVPGDRRRTPLEVMRAAAERIARETVVGKLNPQQHKHAEAKAGRDAFKAAAAQDWEAALRARRQQLFSGLMFKATMGAKERADEIRGHMAKLAKKPAQERFARAGWEAYLDKVNQILRAFDFRRMSARELERRKSLRAWVEAQQEEGDVTAIPEALLERVEAERVQNWKEVKFEELEAAFDAVRNIEHLARLKNKLLLAAGRKDRDEAVEEMVARAADSLPDTIEQPVSAADLTDAQRAGRAVAAMRDALDRPENVVEALDGGEAGPWHDYFWGALTRAEDRITGYRKRIGAELKALRSTSGEVFDGLGEAVTFKGVRMTRATLISAVLNTGNAGNLQRLVDGGIAYNGRQLRLTDADVAELRGMLTAAELRYVQGLWDSVNGLWPEVVDLTRRMSGLPPEKVEAQEFVVRAADGAEVRMRGGYWPLAYDRDRSAVGENQTGDDALRIMMGQGFTKAATPKGHTKERAARFEAPLLLDFGAVMSRHLDQVMTDLAYREAVRDTMSLLNDQRVKDAIIQRLGRPAYDNLRGAVAYSVSASNEVAGQVARDWRVLADAALANMSVSALAIRPDIALGNYASQFVQGLDRVGLRGLARGMAALYIPGQRARMTEAIRELSPFMAQRLDETDFAYGQEIQRTLRRRGLGAAYKRVAMTLHRWADAEVSRATWWGRYQNELARGTPSAEAARLADKTIRQTQTAQGRKDLSVFERDPAFRQSRQFMGPMFVMFGRMNAAARGQGANRNIGSRAATILFQVFFAPALFALVAGRWPEEGDDEDEEIGLNEWSVWLAANTLLFPVQTIPILRDAASALEASLTGNRINPRAAPVAAAVTQMVKAGDSIWDNLADEEGDGLDYLALTRDVTAAVAPLTGAPASQVRITTRSLEYLQDNPEAGEVEMARLAVYGPPR